MRGRLLIVSLLLLAGSFRLHAQDHSVSVLDGPVIKTDTVKRKPQLLPMMGYPLFSTVQMPSFLSPDPFETKEQRAARINAMTAASLMSSLNGNLSWYRPPRLSEGAKWALFVGALFLSNPYAFPKGAVPMMNTSNPFIYAYTPGWAPYDHPYSPEVFPQSIRLEFDFTTGTYKQVMVRWDDLQKNMANSFGNSYQQYAPIPTDPLRPAYWNTP
jgi:hypothetical protein